eukprot:GFYU01000889.1.p2 GENE.GFYU01000889.1~~GFYU01000889.1.p2  ORF type:complete len:440 (-),score=170.59 GFYU01000889.1:237-1481(-)
MDRVNKIMSHLSAQPTAAMAAPAERDDDVVIVSALRTPITKAKRGGLKDTHADNLLAACFKATLDNTKFPANQIGDICVGNVLQPGAGAMTARVAQFLAGIPEETPIHTVNRQCSSGLQAAATIASEIKAGVIDAGLAGGFESMSMYNMAGSVDPEKLNPKMFEHEKASQCLMPMGITSENVASRFNISREKQDAMAADSHRKAAAAQKNGWFDAEIVPIKTTVKDKEGNEQEVTITKDDGVREGTTPEKLAKLRPAFSADGTTTAGNSSQVSDGAAAVLLMSRAKAREFNLPVLGTFVSFAVVGVPPDVMGIGPAFAIPEALKKANLSVSDIDIYEINEAFASQAVYSVEKLGIPMEKVNPKGGAIAFGHPLGTTGARQIATLLHELKRTGKKHGVVSMCIGTGMGAAGVFRA